MTHRDPWREVDAHAAPNIAKLAQMLEARGRTPTQRRLRRRFLGFVPIRPGAHVLEVGCGTGVVLRDAARMAGARGRVTGIDPSRELLKVARLLCAAAPGHAPMVVREGAGATLPFGAHRFDVALAITVILHVAEPLAVVREMVRVTRKGGRVGLQDQDFGVIAVAHPDHALTDRIMHGVARHIYEEPYSGRRLPGLLRAAGLHDVRLRTDVYQDTALEPFSKIFLERRAENAVQFGIVDEPTAQTWLDGFTTLVAEGGFVLTMNYYGAVGEKR
ncbi:MAG: methyltransferase domain-containing protein [Candidatus Rokuibacteriota bacterium]